MRPALRWPALRFIFSPLPAPRSRWAARITDSAGRAETFLRLPAAEGIAAVTVEAPSISQAPATFYARAAGSSLSNFPKLIQAGDAQLGNGPATIAQKGALLTAVASILRYRQNRGELRAPNGTADPATLNQFLKSYCSVDAKGHQLCDGFLAAGAPGRTDRQSLAGGRIYRRRRCDGPSIYDHRRSPIWWRRDRPRWFRWRSLGTARPREDISWWRSAWPPMAPS